MSNEVLYLKATIANQIKVRKRYKDEGTGKFKMVDLPHVLKNSIRSVLKPEFEAISSVEELLTTFLT